MGTIYLVRHGQASFGAADYDQLSNKGFRQAELLGAYWREQGLVFDAVYSGTLRRHQQTMAGLLKGLGLAEPGLAAAYTHTYTQSAKLNEYDSDALLATLETHLPKPDSPEAIRLHFRALCSAMEQWQHGSSQPVGMPAWRDFQAGVMEVLHEIRVKHLGQHVLLVSSGGPIATAVAAVMGAPDAQMIGLNMRIRNTAVTELGVTAKRINLHSFNTTPHLVALAQRELVTMT
ncbi:histidine phosphatase family protein [Lampropedia puyangensis]|uniref:Histidine phosphatase family protein n=1 Tax=Lampropedia puyangensis TaxID=1330072 RepID=A0A4S8EWR1_9BURK|nr:histidine phosphatase family protein [Lampropedia puyangensis]THT99337.1 histidine phosphatase family protein [Lampropedia puyangensis]